MEALEGQVPVQPAATQGQVPVPPAPVAPDPLAQPPAPPPADIQGQVEGQVDPNVQEALRLANQRQARIYQLEQQLAQTNEQVQQIIGRVAQPPQSNPYDPNSQSAEYWRWEMRSFAKEAAQETEQRIMSGLQQTLQQQQEMEFQRTHPDANIGLLKAWGRANGVTNLEHAYTLTNLPQTQQQIQSNAIQQTFQQLNQAPRGATPVRGVPVTQGPVQPKPNFKPLLEQWAQNPDIANTWTPELRAAFDAEVAAISRLPGK